jgi:hypothetical protein
MSAKRSPTTVSLRREALPDLSAAFGLTRQQRMGKQNPFKMVIVEKLVDKRQWERMV